MKKKCKNCSKQFETTNSKKAFCSDKCKVAFGRKQVDGKEVKVASDVVVLNKKEKKMVDDAVKELGLINEWNQVKDFCFKEGITPIDLINNYKKTKRIVNSVDKNKDDKGSPKSKSDILKELTARKFFGS